MAPVCRVNQTAGKKVKKLGFITQFSTSEKNKGKTRHYTQPVDGNLWSLAGNFLHLRPGRRLTGTGCNSKVCRSVWCQASIAEFLALFSPPTRCRSWVFHAHVHWPPVLIQKIDVIYMEAAENLDQKVFPRNGNWFKIFAKTNNFPASGHKKSLKCVGEEM